jgi:hypothetical protein
MPRTGWRAKAVGVGLAWGCVAAGTASAQAPMPKGMVTPAPITAVQAPDVLPSVTSAEVVKDLTPPGLAEPVVFAEPHKAEGPAGCVTCKSVYEEGGLFVNAEYLLWRPRRGAFDYAIGNTSTGLATTGELLSLNYELQSGVRGTIGYHLEGAWDVLFTYTHLGSSDGVTTTAGPGQVFFPTLTRPGLTDQATSVVANGSLQYNIYDAMLGKRIMVDERFSGRVFGGLKFADIRQDFNAAYNGLDANLAAVSAKSTFYGIGPSFGLEGQFGGWKGLHVYTQVSGGLIAGKVNNPLIETNNGGQTVYVNLKNDGRRVIPTATLGIGGGWQYHTLTVRFGYELTSWIGLIDQPRFVDDVGQGKLTTRVADLTLEGFIARVGLTF